MAQQVGSLSVELAASVAAFQRDLNKAVAAVDSSQARMNRSLAAMEQGFARVASSLGQMAIKSGLAFLGIGSLSSAGNSVVRTMLDIETAAARAGKSVDKDLVAAVERLKRSTLGIKFSFAVALGDALTVDADELKARIALLESISARGTADLGRSDEIARLKKQLAELEQIKAEKSLDERLDAEQSVRDAIDRENKRLADLLAEQLDAEQLVRDRVAREDKELQDAVEAQADLEKQLHEDRMAESNARSLAYQEELEAKQKLYDLEQDATFERMGEAIKRQKTAVEDFQDAVNSLTDSWADGLTRVLLRMDSMKDVMRYLIMQMASNAMTSFVTGPIMSALGSAIFGGARAGGGPITAGSTYLVGENGPELMTAGASGSITPLQGSRGGQSKTVIGAINVGQGASVAAVAALQRVLAQVNASIEPRAVAANNAARRRGVSK